MGERPRWRATRHDTLCTHRLLRDFVAQALCATADKPKRVVELFLFVGQQQHYLVDVRLARNTICAAAHAASAYVAIIACHLCTRGGHPTRPLPLDRYRQRNKFQELAGTNIFYYQCWRRLGGFFYQHDRVFQRVICDGFVQSY